MEWNPAEIEQEVKAIQIGVGGNSSFFISNSNILIRLQSFAVYLGIQWIWAAWIGRFKG